MKKQNILKKLTVTSLLIGATFSLAGCGSATKLATTSINSEKTSTSQVSLSKINELTNLYSTTLAESKYLTYDNVVAIMGEGVVSYPTPSDKTLQVVYWTFEENGYEYYLDTIFFEDNLINVETRLTNFPKSLPNSNIDNFKKIQTQIVSAKDFTELSQLIGEGTKLTHYYNVNSYITAWSYDNKFLVAEVSTNNELLGLKTTNNLNDVFQSSASCH